MLCLKHSGFIPGPGEGVKGESGKTIAARTQAEHTNNQIERIAERAGFCGSPGGLTASGQVQFLHKNPQPLIITICNGKLY